MENLFLSDALLQKKCSLSQLLLNICQREKKRLDLNRFLSGQIKNTFVRVLKGLATSEANKQMSIMLFIVYETK